MAGGSRGTPSRNPSPPIRKRTRNIDDVRTPAPKKPRNNGNNNVRLTPPRSTRASIARELQQRIIVATNGSNTTVDPQRRGIVTNSQRELDECRAALERCHATLVTKEEALTALKLLVREALTWNGTAWSVDMSVLRRTEYLQSLVTLADAVIPAREQQQPPPRRGFLGAIHSVRSFLRNRVLTRETVRAGLNFIASQLAQAAAREWGNNRAARDFAVSAGIAVATRVARQVAERFSRGATRGPRRRRANFGANNVSAATH